MTWERRPSCGCCSAGHRGGLASAAHAELVAFARANYSRFAERFADRVQAACTHDHFVAPDYLVRAKSDSIRLAAAQLLLIGGQRRTWQRRMGELLLGAPRRGKANKPAEHQPGQGFHGGEIYLSFPGLGDRLAARVAGEFGDHIEQFPAPNSLQCYAGKAPVMRRSGKSERDHQGAWADIAWSGTTHQRVSPRLLLHSPQEAT